MEFAYGCPALWWKLPFSGHVTICKYNSTPPPSDRFGGGAVRWVGSCMESAWGRPAPRFFRAFLR
eukprot:10258072-Alexandrium_andersonii.AAC.1